MEQIRLGISGGGTKTRGVIFCGNKPTALRVNGRPSNPNRIGLEAAAKNLIAVVREIAAMLGGQTPQTIAMAVSGVAHPEVHSALSKHLSPQIGLPFFLCSDAEALLAATAMDGPVMGLISGTGAIAMMRRSDGQLTQTNGMLPSGGDPGSATWIGQQALNDPGNGPLSRLMRGHVMAEDRAALAVLVHEAALAKDERAANILDDAGGLLAQSVIDLCHQETREIRALGGLAALPLGLSGGVLENSTGVRDAFYRDLTNEFGTALRPHWPAQLPEWGALCLANRISEDGSLAD